MLIDDQPLPFAYTLERPWLNNVKNESCIPAGTYQVTQHTSPKFGKCFKIHDVPERTDILIHHGNYVENSLGCVLIGSAYDGKMVMNSRTTLKKLLDLLDEFVLEII